MILSQKQMFLKLSNFAWLNPQVIVLLLQLLNFD